MNLTYSMLPAERQTEVLPLLIRCFPDYWGAYSDATEFPIKERSFVALDGDHIAGHVGLIEFETAGQCDGEVWKMGGIASVAVDPDYRKRGIAATLCTNAIAWSKANGIDMLPLYTALTPVYAGLGWQISRPYPAASIRQVAPCQIPARPGSALTEAEQNQIIRLYQNHFSFPGKVLRRNSGVFHSWERLFADPNYHFRLWENAYLLESEAVTIELYGSQLPEEALTANPTIALPPNHPAWPRLMETLPPIFDPWHQELPMLATTRTSLILKDIYFPPADKF